MLKMLVRYLLLWRRQERRNGLLMCPNSRGLPRRSQAKAVRSRFANRP